MWLRKTRATVGTTFKVIDDIEPLKIIKDIGTRGNTGTRVHFAGEFFGAPSVVDNIGGKRIPDLKLQIKRVLSNKSGLLRGQRRVVYSTSGHQGVGLHQWNTVPTSGSVELLFAFIVPLHL